VVLTKHVYATQSKMDPFHAWVYRHTSRVIGVSELVSENVRKTVPIDPAKVVTLYNGLDLKRRWSLARVRQADLRKDFGVPPQSPVLGFAGRMNDGKDPGVVLEAFSRLARRFPSWHLVLVGRAVGEAEEHYLEHLKNEADRKHLARRVHFVPYRTDMPEVMRTFDIFVCASKFESFGMVVIEAMSMESAAVGSASGGIPEIIDPGVNGELFAPGNAGHLAEKLARLMSNPAYRKRLGREGRKTVQRRFSLEQSARQVLSLYQTLLRER
jgi:glycosyltransferase involved in cell wall biosynthesis